MIRTSNLFKRLMKMFCMIILLFGAFVVFAQTIRQSEPPAKDNSQVSQTKSNPSHQNTVPLSPAASPDTQNSNPANVNRVWNLENADIRVVIDQVARQTDKNFVIDPRVQGKISLISNTPLDPIELYAVFLKVLQTHGYVAIQSGKVIEIVPDNAAKGLEIPTVTLTSQSTGSRPQGFVTQIIPVKYSSVSQLIPILRPLLPIQSSEISAYAPNNSLIISAEADKITQIEKIVQELDQPTAANIQIVPLRYADAVELVSSLKSIMGSSAKTDAGINIAADKSSNSVLLSGPESQRERLQQVILRMDRLSANSAAASVTTIVVPLKYLQAKDFAGVLQKMVSGNNIVDSSSAQQDASTAQTAEMKAAGIPGMPSYGAAVSAANNASSNSIASSDSSKIQIQAEVQTNAILLSGPPGQVRALKAVIERLDKKPQQVLVEAIIAEVSETAIKNLGVEWGTLPPSGQLAQSASGAQSLNASNASLSPPFSQIVGGSGVGILDMGRFKAVIRALASDNKTNILSTPSVVVLDNQEATVKVGKTITDVTGSYITPNSPGANGNTGSPFQTFSPKEIALHLTVTPQISLNENIRMKIDQGNDTQLATSTNGNPDTSNSAIKTAVIMKSGQVLVIGGLLSNDYEDSIQKIPLLGDIPVLGKLFQTKSDNLAKRNLLVFLRPVIMNDLGVSNEQSSLKYNLMRELELERKKSEDILTPAKANLVMPKYPGPCLPKPF
jgi:general secretion pathway protein D